VILSFLRSRPVLCCALAVLVGAACGNGRAAPAPTATPATRLAPALVQVENGPGSRPQAGLQEAGVVYEYLTEGGITRFTVVFWNPSGAFRAEPVRSARLVTLRLVRAYGGLLLYSGASDHVQAEIDAGHLPAVSESSDGGRYFARDPSRPAPHNLYTTGDQMREALERMQLRVSYPATPAGEPPAGGERVSGLAFQQTPSHAVTYQYAAGSRTYAYSDERGPLVDAGGRQVAITSVVLVRVAHHGAGYTEDVLGAEGIDFDLAGSGSADVYTRGGHLAARWDLTQGPLRLLDAGGGQLPLPAGLTWVHLVDPDMPVQAG
jgi:Protein of unknown function (DUF3048) N-terminal domain/Protein of unknown function (DUF3048) C-terminal domain